jgi:formylglycine-generating enzyme required for sulfatase activity
LVQQPANRTNFSGSAASFEVAARGTFPLAYQWRYERVALAAATNTTLLLASVQTNQAGEYDVVVANDYGSVTSSVAVLTVVPLVPNGMVLIPSGSFAMGDIFAEGYSQERPWHTVEVAAFYIDRTEVTKGLWDEVYAWAVTNGYNFDSEAGGKAKNHPAHSMSWYDALKWCNARSEKEGRVPAYYTDAGLTGVYRTSQVNVSNEWVRWTGGYRLPTEAEWEKAARGGVAAQRFGFGNTITHGQANYYSRTNYAYDISPTRGYHPTYNDGVSPFTSPVGSFGANGYGLYDMMGNVWEWCWDWYGGSYYSSSPETDPLGPTSGSLRVFRGGSWIDGAINCRSTSRNNGVTPDNRGDYGGFRAVLAPAQPPSIVGQPVGRTNLVDTTASFGVTATGTLPLVYQWRYAGAALAGATNGTLVLANVQTNQAGAYDVVVTNAYGSVTSSVAVLTVLSRMVLIPAGSFAMGDTLDGSSDAVPVHTVQVGAFYMDRTEVTKTQWDEVYLWAVTNNYSFDFADSGQGKAPTHPAQYMTWYDAVKWCNARSQKEGRVPAYYTNASQTGVYRSGQVNVQNDWVKWTNGYRLPTEAEWEKAARGGVAGQRFGFGDTITHGHANYKSYLYAYDLSPTRGYHPTYNDGVGPFTSPVGSFGANGYGLHDMAGNTFEWCWDWYGSYSSSPETDPQGPASGSARVVRGGSWFDFAVNSRSANRNFQTNGNQDNRIGFRAVLSPGQP